LVDENLAGSDFREQPLVIEMVEAVNRELSGTFDDLEPEGLREASQYLLDAGGKRLRPVMMLTAGVAVGGDWRELVSSACSVELVHNFTLIHDDIMDSDNFRKGIETVHHRFGQDTAILAGDTLYAKALEILSSRRHDPHHLLQAAHLLTWACVEICAGQWLDIRFEDRKTITEDDYLEMAIKKTGVLYEASAGMGGLLGGGTEKQVTALRNFGRRVGLGFQIRDDVLDLIATTEKLGKDAGSDLVEGKKTLIALHALRSGANLPKFGQTMSPDELKDHVAELNRVGSIRYAMDFASRLMEESRDALRELPAGEGRDLLGAIADYMINLDY